jgi:membrane fusion protein (multidrug efflux system)
MKRRLVIVIVALAVLFGSLFGFKYYQSLRTTAMQSMPQPPATVSAAGVELDNWQPYLHSVGSVVATEGVYVSNEIAGQVREIRFESGQHVNKGDLLLRLDDSVDQAELEGFIAERRLARLEYDRRAKLLREKSVSRSDYDTAEATLENAQASVQSKMAVIAKKAIRAPFSGQLGIRLVNIGQYLAPGSQIVSLQSLDPVYVDYALPERHLAGLKPGQSVLIGVQAYPGRVFEGRITAIEPRIDVGTRSIQIRATLENSDNLLRPGMFTEVRTVLPQRKDVLTLPRTAIIYNPYGDAVYVIEEHDGVQTAQLRQVRTGEARQGRVEISEGLQAGDLVVTSGQVKLRNGQAVQIDDRIKLDQGVNGES